MSDGRAPARIERGTAPSRYPLDYMDRGCLAATSLEHGCSNAPTWELVVAGRIEPHDCERALEWLVKRHPSCASRVRPEPRSAPKGHTRYYEVVAEPDLAELFRYLDLREYGSDALEKLRTAIRDRFIDPYADFPLHVTLARTSDDRAHLFFKQHHALADGRAFIEMLQDFAVYLDHAATGSPVPEERFEVYPRQDEFRALEIGRLRGWLWGLAGLRIWLGVFWRLARAPLSPLLENRAVSWRGSDEMLHLVLDRALLERWRPWRQRAGVSLNSVLSAALCLASRRWNLEHGVRAERAKLSLVAETRPRHGRFRSFANHLAGLMVELSFDPEPDALELMRSIQTQVARQVATNAHKKRLIFERALTARIPLDDMRKALFTTDQPSANLNLSNLISLRFPTLEGRDWRVEAIEITTPVLPPFGVMLTVIDYNGKLRFNFNYKASVVNRAQVVKLARHFERALDEVAQRLAQLPEAAEGERASAVR